eukprot:m.442807 g.442807  ORF g.442807 m.442807 type:complete len:367 (+) comp56817_c0_seq45:1061-2161(+)
MANDFSESAVEAIRSNVLFNDLDPATNVRPSHADASLLMYQHRAPMERFDVVDLDPYGSAVPFLDAAVQAVTDGGLLCVTCTDLAILCGNHPETCYGKYGSMPLKAKYCHEMAVRIMLSTIAAAAGRYRRRIVPLVSLSIDFYARVFVRVNTSPAEVKRLGSQTGIVYHCPACDTHHVQAMCKAPDASSHNFRPQTGPNVDRQCDQCGRQFIVGGPVWTDPIHDKDFAEKVCDAVRADSSTLKTANRILGQMAVIQEELHDVPFYYTLDHLSRVLHVSTPSMLQLRSAIIRHGYRVSTSHANANAIKTDAPHTVLWDIMRCWVGIGLPFECFFHSSHRSALVGRSARPQGGHLQGYDSSARHPVET